MELQAELLELMADSFSDCSLEGLQVIRPELSLASGGGPRDRVGLGKERSRRGRGELGVLGSLEGPCGAGVC